MESENNIEEVQEDVTIENVEEESTEDNENDIYVEESFSEDNNNNDNKELAKKMLKLMIIITAGVILLFVILWFISLFRTRTYSYEQVEKIMKDAAISYFKDHKKSLPKGDQKVEISANTLINNEYMKSLNDYLGEDSNCSGKVSVKKIEGKYIYSPYLDCGKKYSSEELYKAVTKNFVTSGDGLYNINGNYIFRGENVNNYVKLNKKIWRIVKITPDKKVMLIMDSFYYERNIWDDRYNETKGYNAGINDYRASRMRTYLEKAYKNNDKDNAILDNNDRSKLVAFDLCIGKRDLNSNVKDNSEECKDVLENQKIGLLTASDYLMASIDKNCNTTLDYSCQNYNYLGTRDSWSLITAVSNNDSEIYKVDRNVITNKYAMSYSGIRPVIVLNDSVMIKSGKGTEKHPYKIK